MRLILLCMMAIPALLLSACAMDTSSLARRTPGREDLKIGNGAIEFALTREGSVLTGRSLTNVRSGFNWAAPGASAGACLTRPGESMSGFDGKNAFAFAGQRRVVRRGVVEQKTHWKSAEGLILDWTVKSFPGVGVIECGAALENSGSIPVRGLTGIGPLALHLRDGAGRLRLHWLTRTDYRLKSADFNSSFSLSGGSWNAPDAAGWLAIENVDAHEILFIGVEWESYWRLGLQKQGNTLLLTCTLERFERELAPKTRLTGPRLFLGVSHGDLDDSLRDLHDYLRQYVMPPRLDNFPWVTYDIWGTEASGVERDILAEIPFAADLGVEVFYLDAGWYDGSCKNGSGDWFTGVGNWLHEDRVKYPSGLAAISQQIHKVGMKSGLWVDPQVIDSGLVGKAVPQTWVAKGPGGKVNELNLGNGWAPVSTLCLGNPEVVASLKTTLAGLVEKNRLDWLKWDNSALTNEPCCRGDHGHAPGDGALAALRGEYEIYQYLHERFPKLVLENCGYPSRLDYGLARFARVNWLSDNTASALGCRRSQIHGSHVLPAAGNTAWIVRCDEVLNEKNPEKLDTIVRSRMLGLFGMGTINGKLSERISLLPPEVIAALRRNIANYKRYRHLLMEDVYHVLPLSEDPNTWDGVEFCARDGSEAVLLAFRGGAEVERQIRLRGLMPGARYELTSLKTGRIWSGDGSQLMAEGLKVTLPEDNSSEIVLLKRQ